ncbi:putative hexokinase [Helianthus annuus]|nr:putative hexokinase [Helianthus annuus]
MSGNMSKQVKVELGDDCHPYFFMFVDLDVQTLNFIWPESELRTLTGYGLILRFLPVWFRGSKSEFFDFIALALKEFIERTGNNSQLSQVRGKHLGFTFLFPVKQTSVSSGTLIKWTKGFAIEDMVSLTTY